jgi:hypothetical protein
VRFATFSGTLPLAVALLVAAALGALVALALGRCGFFKFASWSGTPPSIAPKVRDAPANL